MASKDPFEFLSQTKASPETILSLEQKRKEEGNPSQSKPDPFDFLSPDTQIVSFTPDPVKVGKLGAFASGVKKGAVESFSAFGMKTTSPELHGASEHIANLLGSFVGLGIGFIPYGLGTGTVLRGLGLAESITNPAVYGFVRNTLAGIAQGVGMSENKEELAQNIALGATLGAGIEGAFLAKAMRARSGLKLLETGASAIEATQLAKEIAVAPSVGESPEDIVASLRGLFSSEDATVDDALVSQMSNKTTMKIKDPSPKALKTLATRFPQAQIVQRGNEFLIHNPSDSLERLSDIQLKQYKSLGQIEGMEGIYKGKSIEFTGEPATSGYVQIREPGSKSAFAVKVEDVGTPIFPKISSKSAVTQSKLNQILSTVDPKVGFTMASGDMIQYGVVDTSDYLTVTSIRQAKNLKIQPGVKGLIERDNGIVTGIHVLDDATVTFENTVPNLGQVTPDYVGRELLPDGVTERLSYIRPSWKNSLTRQLRTSGIAEKDIPEYLALAEKDAKRKVVDLADNEFKTVSAASEAMNGGCF